MRRTDEPIDPEIAAELDAIDATLAGDPVDPRHAELAELALLIADQRPRMDAASAAELDQRVARRFAEVSADDANGAAGARRRWSWGWSGGLAGAAAAAAVIAVVVVTSGGNGGPRTSPSVPVPQTSAGAASSSGVASTATRSIGAPSAAANAPSAKPNTGASAAGAGAGASAPSSAGAAAASPDLGVATSSAALTPAPQPPANGRKIVQSADLELTAAASRIDDVAQEVFNVVGRENGIVNGSSVTAGNGGYAQFRLSIPSSNLGPTMTALSQLRYARVSSRTDTTRDVNGQYVSAVRQLADDRALRTSLLRQLANATTQIQINSLKAQLKDAEQAIARDEAALRSLNNRINYSQVTVTIDSGVTPVPVHHSSRGFTLGQAAHDAGRVVTVAAGVALIAAAALVPVAVVCALGWWIASAFRRRRREQALDLA